MDKCKKEVTIRNLLYDINSCIDKIVMARIEGNVSAEAKALIRTKALIVETLEDLMVTCDPLDVIQKTSKDEESIPSDVKEQATEAAILTACSEFKRFCDTMIDCSANSDKSVPEVFKHKKYWFESFERELRNKLQAHQPMQG